MQSVSMLRLTGLGIQLEISYRLKRGNYGDDQGHWWSDVREQGSEQNTSMSMPGPAGPECDCARIGAFEVTYSRLAGLMCSNEAMDSS